MGEPAQIRLSPKAIRLINDILSRYRSVEITVRDDRLMIFETRSKKRYEVVIQG